MQAGRGSSYQAPAPSVWTRRLDSVFLHPIAGPLVFLLVVIGVFQTIFTGAKPLMQGVQDLVTSRAIASPPCCPIPFSGLS